MKKPGEKGKCLNCEFCRSPGGDWISAWCMYKNMRYICGGPDRSIQYKNRKELINQNQGKAIELLKNRINPSWCPLRKED